MQKESIEPMLSIIHQQQQLYDYTLRLRFGEITSTDPFALYAYQQRYNLLHIREQPKPSYSYIGLIAMAILSTPDRQLVLSDIYQWILDHYPYFRARGSGWRNSIRHNLSLNDCFVKAGRSINGKGHYWCIHPANLADFISGDFRRRRAQRRVRKSMGLSVPDDENDDDNEIEHQFERCLSKSPIEDLHYSSSTTSNLLQQYLAISNFDQSSKSNPRKRCFDVDSLLAPDQPCLVKRQKCYFISSPNSKSNIA